jgi:ATP-dependent DNA helicase RecG
VERYRVRKVLDLRLNPLVSLVKWPSVLSWIRPLIRLARLVRKTSASSRPFPTHRLQNQPLVDLARAVTYRRRTTLDGIDAKVVDNVSEYGFVTNKTLQRLFDIDVYAARNMLSDLRDRELLAKIGKARGGPGVKYGPGKKFPKKRSRRSK